MNLELSSLDYAALSPLLIILVGSLVLLLVEIISPINSKKVSATLTFCFLLVALFASFYSPVTNNPLISTWLKFDFISKFFTGFFILIGLATTLLSTAFFQRFEVSRGEYYFLLLSSLSGLILIASAADFLILFLGIETLSISLYIQCAYMKSWNISKEAALKYFIMGSLAAAFLLYGIALIYGAVGSTNFDKISLYNDYHPLLIAGIILITIALAFEAAVVPFHIWAPDVYAGASTPVTAFMSIGTKAGAFAAFIRIFMMAFSHFHPFWSEAIVLLAYPTLIYANYVAIRQTQLRRFFAYSGISHAGFMLIPIAVGTPDALHSLLFYLIVYTVATLGCFAVLTSLDWKEEGVLLEDLKGLFGRAPFLAIVFTICLLTLAGIPPTIGFFAKFYIFKVAFQAGYYGIVVVGLLTTVLAAFYYIRIISLMFERKTEVPRERISISSAIVAACALVLIFYFTIYPVSIIKF